MKTVVFALLAVVVPGLAGCTDKQVRPASACQSGEAATCSDMQDHSNGGAGNSGSGGGGHGGSAGGGMGGGM
jgi:hypothetical protein